MTYDRLLHADREPQNWLSYSGNYAGHRYSPLSQINRTNVKNLQLKWSYHPLYAKNTNSQNKMENTPLVVDGIMYTGTALEVVALDAVTGRAVLEVCAAARSEGVLQRVRGQQRPGDRRRHVLFWATVDCHLIAIDATSGRVIWDKVLADYKKGYQYNVPPLVVRDKVILGPATNEMGANCWVAAYDIKTGKELWRFDTAPNSRGCARGEDLDGRLVEARRQSDLERRQLRSGNEPDVLGDRQSRILAGTATLARRPTTCIRTRVIALDADTGKLKWYYQFTPGDEYDWDATQVPVLVDMEWQGRPRKLMLWANRNGFFYVLDRVTGQFLMGKAFVKQTWNDRLRRERPSDQEPRVLAQADGRHLGLSRARRAAPTGTRRHTARAPDFSTCRPGTTTAADPAKYTAGAWKERVRYTGSTPPADPSRPVAAAGRGPPAPFRKEEEGYGAIRALDPKTGEKKWDFKMVDFTESGVLSTGRRSRVRRRARGQLLRARRENRRAALDVNLGGPSASGPISYAVGRQTVHRRHRRRARCSCSVCRSRRIAILCSLHGISLDDLSGAEPCFISQAA